jgi:hypothetical protein
MPLASNVAVWPARGVLRLPVTVQAPPAGMDVTGSRNFILMDLALTRYTPFATDPLRYFPGQAKPACRLRGAVISGCGSFAADSQFVACVLPS